MRRRLLITLLAAAAGTISAPLWGSLTSDVRSRSLHAPDPHRGDAHTSVAHPLAEAGGVALTGGVLIGLASAIRRPR
jgi:hypothetical protein